jgi:hypothetical protein
VVEHAPAKNDFDVIYERNSENSHTNTHSMSIKTLTSPHKMSPIKMEAFNFKGRIFEINDEDYKTGEHIISQKPMEDIITPRIETERLPESSAPSKSNKRVSTEPSGDSGGTPE